MSYFSRLTDIVTCNLTEMLAEATDPEATLEEIIAEMRRGVSGAQRSVKTAAANEARIRTEMQEHAGQVQFWTQQARNELEQSRETEARHALRRKREVEDLIAGLSREHNAAQETLNNLSTTLHALEARLADAVRRRAALSGDQHAAAEADAECEANHAAEPAAINQLREDEIEAELAALKREIGC